MEYWVKSRPTWCAWCWDLSILAWLKAAFKELDIPPEKIVLVAWIWCWSLIPYWVNTYWLCTLHWRAIPIATWIKVANKWLTVIANVWDWDGLWIWLGHYAHFFRRNLDITILIDNNWIYGLTKGQTSPTSPCNTISSSTPFGSLETPVNWLALALTMGATFVSRSYAWDIKSLTNTIVEAIKHKWSSVVEILQPCVTFNKVETYEYYNARVKHYNLLSTREEAYKLLTSPSETIPVWIFFKEDLPTYEDRIPTITQDDDVDVSSLMVRNS